MKHARQWISLALVTALAGCSPSSSVKQKQTMTNDTPNGMVALKRRVGVVDFLNKTKYGEARLGSAASDVLITELVKSGKFIVVERSRLETLMGEQKLGMSGAIDATTAAKVGKVLGLNAIV